MVFLIVKSHKCLLGRSQKIFFFFSKHPYPREGFLMAQLVKNLPAMRATWVRLLGWEDPLEKGKATYSDILAWRIPWTV